MSRWVATLDVKDVWKDDFFTTEEQMLIVSGRLDNFAANWQGEEKEYLEDLAEELADAAHSENVDWFDQVWAALYDWADDNRVWVATS